MSILQNSLLQSGMIDLRTYESVTEAGGVITATPSNADNENRNYPSAQGRFAVSMPDGTFTALDCIGWDGGVSNRTHGHLWDAYPTRWRFRRVSPDQIADAFAFWGTLVAQKEAKKYPEQKSVGIRTDYTREELIAICERAVVSLADWGDRDSPEAQEGVGTAWVMLRAGCPFTILTGTGPGCHTDKNTIWLEIRWPRFNNFEYGETEEKDANGWPSETIYLPTPQRLENVAGKDWY